MAGLSPTSLIVALMVFYIILGCFDGISMVVLTMASFADRNRRHHLSGLASSSCWWSRWRKSRRRWA